MFDVRQRLFVIESDIGGDGSGGARKPSVIAGEVVAIDCGFAPTVRDT
jgi:hypothetical protein